MLEHIKIQEATMKTTIYYFTGTGNSLNMARKLADLLAETELIPIAKVWQQAEIRAHTENVGFVFPLYFSGVPEIVAHFVKKLDLEKTKYLFAVVTRGGGPADAFHQLEQLLRTKSKTLNLGWYIHLPSNYIVPFYYKYTCPEGEKRQALYHQAEAETREIARLITAQRDLIKEKNVLLNSIARLMRTAYLFYLGDLYVKDTGFCLDETCNACGICAKVCPVDNIVLSEGKPRWQHHCQQCMGCIQLCPQEAIQYGKQTRGKPRYRHPDITIKDIIAQS
jgi:ferredoxin